ncbi:MAG: dihydropteroate synthase [Vicinamibacterales bacterium]
MGVLNITPDSFANPVPIVTAGGPDVARAVETALRMQADGADLIDIGGESTKPGAEAVSADEESARVLPVIEALAGRLSIPISIDTYKAAVAREAIVHGARLVNDVSGLLYEPELGRVAAETGAALILMHTRGRSSDMYAGAEYEDVIDEVASELRDALRRAEAAGVAAAQVVLDPGIGFAKRAAHSYGVLARLPELAARLGRPFLVGPSRKSFMRDALGERPPHERDWGTAAAVAAAVLNGAHVVRVHAVSEMVQVARVAEAIRSAGVEPAREGRGRA